MEQIIYLNPKEETKEFSFNHRKIYSILSNKLWHKKQPKITLLRTSKLRLFHKDTFPKIFSAPKISLIVRNFGLFTYIFEKVWDHTKIKKIQFLSGVNVIVIR